MAMEFGIQFFPCVGPAEKSAADYWGEALHLVGLCDELGFTSVRTVEHYFHPYGGYSPNPIVFLAAAAMGCARARLITGAVLPAFNDPLKLAGELAMLDAISGGRLEAGFARAFLPHEFQAFGVALDESRARYIEGVEQVRRLLEDEVASHQGTFHAFQDITSLPRPTQRPRPPFWVAALATPASFEWAGAQGHGVMAIPMAGGSGLFGPGRGLGRGRGRRCGGGSGSGSGSRRLGGGFYRVAEQCGCPLLEGGGDLGGVGRQDLDLVGLFLGPLQLGGSRYFGLGLDLRRGASAPHRSGRWRGSLDGLFFLGLGGLLLRGAATPGRRGLRPLALLPFPARAHESHLSGIQA